MGFEWNKKVPECSSLLPNKNNFNTEGINPEVTITCGQGPREQICLSFICGRNGVISQPCAGHQTQQHKL